MNKKAVVKKTRVDYTREAHERQLAAGWRRLTLRLPPQLNDDLEALCARFDLGPTQMLAKVLHERVLAEVALQNRKR